MRIGPNGRSDLSGDRPDCHDRFAARTSVDDEGRLVERDRVSIPVGLLHLHQVIAVVVEDGQPRLDVQGFPIELAAHHIHIPIGMPSAPTTTTSASPVASCRGVSARRDRALTATRSTTENTINASETSNGGDIAPV